MTGVTVLFLTFVTLINVVHCQLELSGFRNITLWAHKESQNYVQNRTTLPRAHLNMTSWFKDARSTIIGNGSPRVRGKFCQRCPCACKTLPRKNESFSRHALRRYVAGSASENSPKRTRFNRSR
uniref:uncharacterized protein LOC120332676 isoform X2 n=1 Tax=Styela clava TaxID=7725 RepID=UPI00193954E4|nr:uncharacterized protein LOC120332676 isoform X2 [Styela clava]